jgi:Uma2 family endonuclease
MARSPAVETNTGIWLALNIGSVQLTDDQFIRLCQDNGDFHFEITAEKELIVMTGSNPETDRKNANITMQLGNWATQDGTGVFFGSSAIFVLPNSARRIPDGAWMRKERWNQLSEEQKSTLTEICPDFIIELRSPSDRMRPLEGKMDEYIQNGAQLAWRLDPFEDAVTIYRPGSLPQRIENPSIISGDPELPRFRFDFRQMFL